MAHDGATGRAARAGLPARAVAITTRHHLGLFVGQPRYGALLFATALTDHSINDVLAAQAHRPVLTASARKVLAVTAALGLGPEGFSGFDLAAFMPQAAAADSDASFPATVAHNRRSAKSRSGIWRDLAARKRRTEVDPQLGPVLADGARLGLPTPITAALIELINDIEAAARPLSAANLDALARAA